MNSTTTFDDDGRQCNSCGCVARISNVVAKFCPQCGAHYLQSSDPAQDQNVDPDKLLKIVRKQLILGATEISAYADTPITIKLDGRLRRLADSVAANQIDDLFESVSMPQNRNEFAKTGSTEFKHEFDDMLFASVVAFKKDGQTVLTLHRNFDNTPPLANA